MREREREETRSKKRHCAGVISQYKCKWRATGYRYFVFSGLSEITR